MVIGEVSNVGLFDGFIIMFNMDIVVIVIFSV